MVVVIRLVLGPQLRYEDQWRNNEAVTYRLREVSSSNFISFLFFFRVMYYAWR